MAKVDLSTKRIKESESMVEKAAGRLGFDVPRYVTPDGLELYVFNRRGEKEPVKVDEILNRVKRLSYGLHELVDCRRVSQAVVNGMYCGIRTSQLDELAAETCAYMSCTHPHYSKLAARIAIDNLHKNTNKTFSEVIEALHLYRAPNGEEAGMICRDLFDYVNDNKDELNSMINHRADFEYDYFGFKTLERSYLLKMNNAVAERPQQMLLRVSCGIHMKNSAVEPGYDLGNPYILGFEPCTKCSHLRRQALLGDSTGLSVASDGSPSPWIEIGSPGNENLGYCATCWKDLVRRWRLARVSETYDLMSNKYFIHATPTLFNAGTRLPQMSSCFLLQMQGDSISGIYETLKQCALISKSAGGIGLSVSDIRGKNSYIRGTNGYSNGLVPMLRVFNDTARYVDQGGGRRKGSFAIYVEPWHSDIIGFLELKKNHGKEEQRARDLFYALWIPDLFMRRVEADADWTLFCPNQCKGLTTSYGKEFEKLYEDYESQGMGVRISAQKLWFKILDSQIESGTPYMLYKDACNEKSNHKHLGTIKCSNLCTEIVQYTAKDEVAVCNLASIGLPRYVRYRKNKMVGHDETPCRCDSGCQWCGEPYFDYQKFARVVGVMVRNLNEIIDRNYYPLEDARRSNQRHRPIGLGIQGLADTFMLMGYPYDSLEAEEMNKRIFETLYFYALNASCDLAKYHKPYESYIGSPVSKGLLQHDMWGVTVSDKWNNWPRLRSRISLFGVRNSLLIAPMPTASTSQILGNNESFEPYTSNIYQRRVLSGDFVVINPHLLNDLIKHNLWNDDMKQKLMAHSGSLKHIDGIPKKLKEMYKTVWDMKQKHIIKMAADRAPFIDQSQSLNIHIHQPDYAKLTSMHFYGWKLGLKTGLYYLRTKPAAEAIKFTIDDKIAKNALSMPAVVEKMDSETTTASDQALSELSPDPHASTYPTTRLDEKQNTSTNNPLHSLSMHGTVKISPAETAARHRAPLRTCSLADRYRGGDEPCDMCSG